MKLETIYQPAVCHPSQPYPVWLGGYKYTESVARETAEAKTVEMKAEYPEAYAVVYESEPFSTLPPV